MNYFAHGPTELLKGSIEIYSKNLKGACCSLDYNVKGTSLKFRPT